MITSTAWRFVWKEYRNLRGLWIGLAVVTILTQLMLALASSIRDPAALSTSSVYTLALIIACFYAVGCGATLFAHEHDESTFDFLRGMPIPWQGILLGKSAVAAASTLLLVVFVTLTGKGATLLALRVFDLPTTDVAWPLRAPEVGAGLLIITETLLWGAFWSLVSRRTLYAVVLAAASWLFCMSVFNWRNAGAIDPMEVALPWRISVIVGLVFLITAIASRWLDERDLPWKWRAKPVAIGSVASSKSFGHRLTWSFWRMSRNFWFALAAIVVMAPPMLRLSNLPNRSLTETSWSAALATFLMSMALAIVCVPVFAGLATFQFDWRKHRYRFLSQLGVDPHRFWLSRQLSATLLFAALALLAVISIAITAVVERDFHPLPGWLLFFPLIAFVTGQFVGLFCRSPIIAVFVAMAVAFVAQIWIILTGYLVDSTWVWLALTCSIFPAMILATWVRTPSWLIDSSRTRDWLRPLLIPVFVLVLQLVGFVAYRVFEVPSAAVAADWDTYAAKVTPAALTTAEQYDALAPEIAIDPENEALLDDILRVASSPTCALHDFRDPSIRACPWYDDFDHNTTRNMALSITDYLLRRAKDYRQSGELSEAWKCYEGALNIANHLYQLGLTSDLLYGFRVEQRVHRELVQWALLPNQESDLLRESADRLRRLGDEQPSLKQSIELQFLIGQSIGQSSMWHSPIATWMPWERVRAARVNRALTAHHLRSVDAMEDRLTRRSAAKVASQHAWGYFGDEKELVSLASRTLIGHEYYSVSMIRAYRSNELLRRGTICALAVARYRVVHGSLPAKIDQLSELPGYDTVVDPTTGKPFEYRPTGMPVETRMWSRNPAANVNEAIVNEAGTPLLWSEAIEVAGIDFTMRKREWFGVAIPIGVADAAEETR